MASHDEVATPILVIAFFGLLRALRSFFAIADRVDPVRRNPQSHQVLFSGCGPAVAQADVLLLTASLVTMPFNGEFDGKILLQEFRVGSENRFRIIPDIPTCRSQSRYL